MAPWAAMARGLLRVRAAMDKIQGNALDTDRALEQTEAEIERTRERLSASLGALRDEISELTDWRSWIERRPLPFLAGAFAFGVLMGLATSGRGR
jgi:hypothetical protein